MRGYCLSQEMHQQAFVVFIPVGSSLYNNELFHFERMSTLLISLEWQLLQGGWKSGLLYLVQSLERKRPERPNQASRCRNANTIHRRVSASQPPWTFLSPCLFTPPSYAQASHRWRNLRLLSKAPVYPQIMPPRP